jgi:predicted GIY-YIG superfamily endonuclease
MTARVADSHRFVYLLQSSLDPRQYYVGLTSNPGARLAAHNAGGSSHSTKTK